MTSRSPPPWSRWVAPAGATHRLHGNTISLSSYTTSGDTPPMLAATGVMPAAGVHCLKDSARRSTGC